MPTNFHIHIFDSECAPRTFLKVINANFVRKNPLAINFILRRRAIRNFIGFLNHRKRRKKASRRSNIDKYLSFLDIASQKRQADIHLLAKKAASSHDPSTRLVALTLNMDHMDDSAVPVKNFNTQLAQVQQIKRYYPDSFFPFLSVDPRAKSGAALLRWAKPYFVTGVQSKDSGKYFPFFSGIKLYPALGFFPFDPRLEALYAYAEKEGIPIMTHCTPHRITVYW